MSYNSKRTEPLQTSVFRGLTSGVKWAVWYELFTRSRFERQLKQMYKRMKKKLPTDIQRRPVSYFHEQGIEHLKHRSRQYRGAAC